MLLFVCVLFACGLLCWAFGVELLCLFVVLSCTESIPSVRRRDGKLWRGDAALRAFLVPTPRVDGHGTWLVVCGFRLLTPSMLRLVVRLRWVGRCVTQGLTR